MTLKTELTDLISDTKTWIDDADPDAKAQSLATINAIADTVYRCLDFHALVEKTVDVIVEYIPVTSVALFRLEETAQWLDLVAWRGFTTETLEVGSHLPVSGSLTGLTIYQKNIITIYDLAQNDQLEPRVKQALLAQGLTGCISVPLLFQEHAIGVANLIFQETHRLTALERETLMAVGKTIGLAMINAQHVNQIEAEVQERRRAEAEIQRYKEHLEELVVARTAELEHANARLVEMIAERAANEQALREINQQLEVAQRGAEQASAAKTVFLSNMSHEIRTPLNVVIGYATAMLDASPIYEGAVLPGIYRRDIQLMHDNAEYMLRLINDLLDLSKIEAGHFQLRRTEVDLVTLLSDVMADSVGLVKKKPILISANFADSLPPVWADPTRVRQIALNLMSNAIKFTKEGRITITAEAQDTFVHVSVIDTGIGISANALPGLFERFQQSDSDMNLRQGSTGLGLHISKQLAQMHGGDLTVASRLNEGSTFTFMLPVAENISTEPYPVTKRRSVTVFKRSLDDDSHDPES